MKLIATLGATQVDKEHIYQIDGKEYYAKISPLALKKHFGIKDEDVYIIGTKDTKSRLGEVIENFNFIEINEDSLENVFQKAMEFVEKDDIVDLTQGFRSFPFGVFLALNFSKIMNKDPYDVYYAQMQKVPCNYRNEVCSHKFVSLKKYLEIGDLAREINSFVASWFVYESEIDNFEIIQESLVNLSKKLLSNDTNVSKDIETIEKEIEKIKEDFSFLDKYFELLLNELNKIKKALSYEEDYKKLFLMAKLYFEKKLILQTLTMLFEAVSAYLADSMRDGFYCIKNDKRYTKNSQNKYAYRNCVKNKLRGRNGCEKWYFKHLKDCEEFRKNMMKIDEIRNNSAHAFINGQSLENFYAEIENLLEFFKIYINI